MLLCENCKTPHSGDYASGRFCSIGCARSSATRPNRAEISAKVSAKLKGVSRPHEGCRHTEEAKQKIRDHHLGPTYSKRHTRESLLQAIFVENSRPAMLRHKYLALFKDMEVCEECGQGATWNGKKLTMQIDHINGNNADHRLENLKVLCPNCHTQTPTWGTRKRKQQDVG